MKLTWSPDCGLAANGRQAGPHGLTVMLLSYPADALT